VLLCAPALSAQPEASGENWLHYGGTEKSWRYSSLSQINTANVKRLAPAWMLQTGDPDGGLQVTPIVENGVMYLSTSRNRVYAIDAKNGAELWQYRYEVPKDFTLIYGPWNRGVAIAGGRVFMGTIDNHVVALDQKTGRELWRVQIEDSRQCGCNITAAPLVVKGLVVTGVTGGDSAHRGYVTALDQKTGRVAWKFWTIPGPGEPGHETWAGDSWKFGGGSSWMTGSYDAELGLIYWSIGNPAADFHGASRAGKNLYTDSVVALEADTGKLRWYHQQIPHDVWDFDTAYENVLLDADVKGTRRKLLVNVNKGGIAFVVDRTNGKFINAWHVVKNLNWVKGVSETGELVGRNEPEVGKTKVLCPSIGGGRSWNQAAYSPRTSLFYTTGIEWCQEVTAQEEKPSEGQTYFGGTFKLVAPPDKDPHGHLGAYDPVTGKRQWTYRSKYPLLASQLATAGDVVFTGDVEGNFFALDARTGARLWNFQTGSGHRGSPIAYSVAGRMYVAAPTGLGSALAGLMSQLWPETEKFRGGSTLVVFALPEEGK